MSTMKSASRPCSETVPSEDRALQQELQPGARLGPRSLGPDTPDSSSYRLPRAALDRACGRPRLSAGMPAYPRLNRACLALAASLSFLPPLSLEDGHQHIFEGLCESIGSGRGQSNVLVGSVANSTRRHRALAKRIWSGVRQRALRSSGLQIKITRLCAREAATLSRFRLKRKSMPRGASSTVEVAIE